MFSPTAFFLQKLGHINLLYLSKNVWFPNGPGTIVYIEKNLGHQTSAILSVKIMTEDTEKTEKRELFSPTDFAIPEFSGLQMVLA